MWSNDFVPIDKGYHQKLPNDKILFIFLPFMHSEELNNQIYCSTKSNSKKTTDLTSEDVINFIKDFI